MRMLSPLGRNAQQCCDSHGLSLHSIHAVCNKLAWSVFYRNSEVPELDKVQIIKELLCVKYGLVSLPLFDVSQVDFILESLCTQLLFLPTFYLYFLYDFTLNIIYSRVTVLPVPSFARKEGRVLNRVNSAFYSSGVGKSVWLGLMRGVFTCVGWHLTRYDPYHCTSCEIRVQHTRPFSLILEANDY